MIDTDQLKSRIDLSDLISKYGVELKRKNGEYVGLCPFHDEQTPSFTVSDEKQQYYCFGCESSGDHIGFIQQYTNGDFKSAAADLARAAGGDVPIVDGQPVKKTVVKKQQEPEWVPVIPTAHFDPPAELSINRGEWVSAPVVASWAYKTADGNLIGYVCRVEFEKPNGDTGKDVIPYTWMRNTQTGAEKPRQGAFGKPRPLYGLELLADNPKNQIIIVEGEKAADAARRILTGLPVTVMTWPGGCKAVSHADFSVLAGRRVAMWPDCDSQTDKQTGEFLPYHQQPGMAAALKISEMISADTDFSIVAVPAPGEWPDGWDLADAEGHWSAQQVIDYIKNNSATADEIIPAPDDEPDAFDYQDDNSGEYDIPHEEPFRILGWDHGRAYYLPAGSNQVTELTAAGHTKLQLLQLATLSYWMGKFGDIESKTAKVDWDLAADSLIRRSQAAGIWNPDLIRGRGAWFDAGRSVVHAGDKVIIEGNEYRLQAAPTDYVYEASRPFKLSLDDPMPNAEANQFAAICKNLRWERAINGHLLAGWVFLAPICGALDWRPHIWITGGAGSGKSTILSRIISPALDGTMVFVQGDTSEAGIRQRVKFDALPVVFDEFESEREKAANRVQDVMSLTTQASSDTGAEILKGSANGKSESFRIRSMFAFASIGVSMKQHAARTRVTVLSLRPGLQNETQNDVDQYNDMIRNIIDTMTPDYIARLQARAVRLIPVIRHNARVFAEAAAMGLGTRRMGDQVGTLLAGAFALYSTKEITRDEAAAWIAKQDWTDVTDGADERDELVCVNAILQHQLRVETEAGLPKTRTIGELLEKIRDTKSDYEIQSGEASDALARVGLRIDRGMLWVANSHRELRRILSGTNYVDGYHRVLLRINGSDKLPPKKFAGVSSRAVSVPLGEILGEKE